MNKEYMCGMMIGIFLGNFIITTILYSWQQGLMTGLLASFLLLLFYPALKNRTPEESE